MAKKYTRIFTYLLFFIITIYAGGLLASEVKQQVSHISYTEAGEGEPLVLIHAFPTDQRLWNDQSQRLAPYFHVITMDLPGFGKAAKTDGQAVTMRQYADAVKQLLDQLHIQKAIIGGESMGGYVALAFLKAYPDNVTGLILSDSQSIADSEEAKQKREASAQAVLAQGPTQLVDDFIPKALSPDAPPQLRQSLREMLESQTAMGIASALRGMALREDTSSILAATKLPILILTGDKDALITPLQSQNMHKLAKNSTLITIKNAGHLSSLEQPEAWNNAVIEMFSK